MLTRFSEDCSFRPGHIDNRNSTVKGNTGEESLAGIIFTLKVAVNKRCLNHEKDVHGSFIVITCGSITGKLYCAKLSQ